MRCRSFSGPSISTRASEEGFAPCHPEPRRRRRISCERKSSLPFAALRVGMTFPQNQIFFTHFPQPREILFLSSKFLFHNGKKSFRAYCISSIEALHCTYFRDGRSMAAVKGS